MGESSYHRNQRLKQQAAERLTKRKTAKEREAKTAAFYEAIGVSKNKTTKRELRLIARQEDWKRMTSAANWKGDVSAFHMPGSLQ